MRKKILAIFITGFTLSAANIVNAQNNFYVGVDAGAADLMNKESHSVNPESHNLGALGPVAGIYAGYAYSVTSQYQIAIEAFLDGVWLQTEIQHANNTYKMNQFYNVGVRLLPAYAFTPYTFGHLILGYANGRFRIKDNGVYGFINSSFNLSGFQAGFGFDTVLTNNFFIRLDALYDIYSSITKTGTGLTTGSIQNYTNRFSQLGGELSVLYKFG